MSADIIQVENVDGDKFTVDLNLVNEVRNNLETVELDMFDGRTLIIAKTQKFLQALFHRTVGLEEAQRILAARKWH